jgi:hypothetical protein
VSNIIIKKRKFKGSDLCIEVSLKNTKKLRKTNARTVIKKKTKENADSGPLQKS